MEKCTYTVAIDFDNGISDEILIRANFAHGSSQIEYSANGSGWSYTPWQVGAFSHRVADAALAVADWLTDYSEHLEGVRVLSEEGGAE